MLKLAQVWNAFTRRRGSDLDGPRLPLLHRAAGGRGAAPEERSLLRQVDEAMRDWQAAQAHFDTVSGVSDPDLVDYAIYNLEAAQRKYVCLLRQVQRARTGLPAGDEEG